jgi:hypothetical protein
VEGISDLTFLKKFPLLLYLEVIGREAVDVSILSGLENLRGLRVDTPGTGIDFTWLPELEVFRGNWHPDNTNIAAARQLRTMHVWQFRPKSADLSALAGAVRLEVLHLVQTNISSLDGLERMEDLRRLQLAYAPKLKSLDAMALRDLGLRELEIDTAKSITSYDPAGSLAFLRDLKISSSAPLPNLKWVRNLSRLEFFSFVNTNVEDGDLRPLLDLPELRYAGTMDKRHYNLKSSEIKAALSRRAAETPAG